MPGDWLTLDEALEEIERVLGCPRGAAEAFLRELDDNEVRRSYWETDSSSPSMRFNAADLRYCLERHLAAINKPKVTRRVVGKKGGPKQSAIEATIRTKFPKGLPDRPVKELAFVCWPDGKYPASNRHTYRTFAKVKSEQKQ